MTREIVFIIGVSRSGTTSVALTLSDLPNVLLLGKDNFLPFNKKQNSEDSAHARFRRFFFKGVLMTALRGGDFNIVCEIPLEQISMLPNIVELAIGYNTKPRVVYLDASKEDLKNRYASKVSYLAQTYPAATFPSEEDFLSDVEKNTALIASIKSHYKLKDVPRFEGNTSLVGFKDNVIKIKKWLNSLEPAMTA